MSALGRIKKAFGENNVDEGLIADNQDSPFWLFYYKTLQNELKPKTFDQLPG